jgi:hypothetical protein
MGTYLAQVLQPPAGSHQAPFSSSHTFCRRGSVRDFVHGIVTPHSMIVTSFGPTHYPAVEGTRMRYRPAWWIWLIAASATAWVSAVPVAAQSSRPWQRTDSGSPKSLFSTAAPVPLDEIPASLRTKVRGVMEKPTLSTRGQAETFTCEPKVYQWLLEHPDRAAVAWRRLGAKVADIADKGNGVFGWSDAQGGDIRWQAVYRGTQMRVWHAEGKVRPAALTPLVPVQAVVVLRYTEGRDTDNRPIIRHQAELMLHTDSKSMSLAARLFGTSAPRLAEQYVSQVETFFSALSWYLEQHPERMEKLLEAK